MSGDHKKSNLPTEVAANIGLLRQLHAELEKAKKLMAQNKLEAADKILTGLVNRESQYFGAWFLLGVLAYRSKQWMPAATYFSRAAMLNPQNEATQLNLARSYIEIEAFDLAKQTLQSVITRAPENAEAHRALGKAHYEDKDYVAAVEALEASKLHDPNSVETLHALGSAYAELGELAQAQASYEAALKMAVGNKSKAGNIPAIISQLLGLPGALDFPALKQQVRQQKKKFKGISSDAANALAFAEARLLEKEGDFAGAWKILSDTNARIWEGQGSAHGNFERRFRSSSAYADTFAPEDFQQSSAKAKGPVPLFIVGASRSGKTTFERLVGASANVQKGYESKVVEHAIARTALQVGLPKLTDFWYLPENVDDTFAGIFGEAVSLKAQAASVFTITYPGSIHHTGRIARTIPNAKFVFMKRDRDDQALRCFQKHYRRGNTYSYNWQACQEFLALYDDLAEMWAQKLGQRALTLSYEDLVEGPGTAVEAASKFLGMSLAVDELPPTGNDVNCAAPYASLIAAQAQ